MMHSRTANHKTRDLRLTVVIPTLGRSPHLRGLLERLQRQVTDFDFEVLVVANIPQQQLRNLVNSMGTSGNGHFDYLETGRLGVNLARNKGLERASAPIVLFLDDDAILESDFFLSMHVAYHERDPEAAAIGGPYRLAPTNSIWDQAYHNIAGDWLNKHRQANGRATQLLGGNLSLKKDLILAHRWKFDDEISFGGAETGLCLRIANAGLPIYFFEDLEIGHAPGLSRSIFCRKAFLQGAGARWREQKIPDLKYKFTNEFRKPIQYESKALASAQALYHLCFEFGWKSSPYETARPLLAPPAFNYIRYAFFRLRRPKYVQSLRRCHRRFYVMLRAAWINGA